MPTITVTGATGQFGNLVINHLLHRGIPPSEIRASVRDVTKAAHHQARDIDVRRGDFDDPQAMKHAFRDTTHLLIISTDRIGERVEQHRRAVFAAKEAGVQHIAYTSLVTIPVGDEISPIAIDHRATERIILESGVPYTFLRNTFYAEYMLAGITRSLDAGVFVSSAGEAKLGSVSMKDLSEGAAVVLSEPGHANIAYDLTYPRAWDFREAVDVVSRVSGQPLTYQPVSAEEQVQRLRQAGIPDAGIQRTMGTEAFIRASGLSYTANDLERLLRRPVISLEALVRQKLTPPGN